MINNMKNLKKTIFGLLALIMVFGLVFTVSAFKSNENSKKQYTYWKYNLDEENGARNGFNYTETFSPDGEGCDDEEEIPCVIRVEDSIQSQSDLNTYLNNQYDEDSEVMELAIHTKLDLSK